MRQPSSTRTLANFFPGLTLAWCCADTQALWATSWIVIRKYSPTFMSANGYLKRPPLTGIRMFSGIICKLRVRIYRDSTTTTENIFQKSVSRVSPENYISVPRSTPLFTDVIATSPSDIPLYYGTFPLFRVYLVINTQILSRTPIRPYFYLTNNPFPQGLPLPKRTLCATSAHLTLGPRTVILSAPFGQT